MAFDGGNHGLDKALGTEMTGLADEFVKFVVAVFFVFFIHGFGKTIGVEK